MDFLKKIRQKIDEFCFNHMRVVLDKWIKKGVADWHDIIWGVIGLLLGVL